MSETLTFCCDDSDLTRPILDGAITPETVELEPHLEYPPKRHREFAREQAWDVSELCLATYVASRRDPEQYPFTAIPIFPSRKFRHSFFYKRSDADVEDPGDLAGKRVGVQSWQTAANVWMRGISREHYGLDLESVTWFRRRQDDVPVPVPDRFDVREISGQQGGDAIVAADDMKSMFFDGELDAVMDPSGKLFREVRSRDDVELLFDDPIEEEQSYFRETGIHPQMHIVAIRDEVLERNPEIASDLFDAFSRATEETIKRNRRPSYNMLQTWAHLHITEQEAILGDETWEHGLTPKNRRELSKFVDYAYRQGLIPEQYAIDDLFVDVQ